MYGRACALAAVGVCLAAGLLAAQHDDHDHPPDARSAHAHTGSGPQFIDAFFTENAYLERKIRPDVGFATGPGGDQWLGEIEVEWALVPSLAVIVHAPFQQLHPESGPTQTGFGDASIGAKYAIVNDRSRFILSFGSDLDIPTGDENRGLGEGYTALAPFLLAWLPFGPGQRFLFQTGLHVDIPLASDAAEHAELGTVLSWTSPQGISPIVEGIVQVPFDGGTADWFVAPEVRWEFLEGWETGAAVRIPVAGPATGEEDWRLMAGLIHHFPLPGGG